jgi:flagellar protein FliL
MAKTAAAPAPPAKEVVAEEAAPPAKKGKKKLIIIIAAVVVLLAAIGGGVAVFMAKKKAAAEAAALAEGEAGEDAAEHGAEHAKVDMNHPPVFVPLEPFIVNLADKDSDRYAQIAVTLQVADAKFAEQLKTFMPAVRNSILMVLAHKTSHELLERSGKQALAEEIMREAVRPMGIYIEAPHGADGKEAAAAASAEKAADKEGGDAGKKKKPAVKEPAGANPIQQVHFANFIIQ